MLNVLSTAISIGGAVTGTSTSWIAIIAAVVLFFLLWAYDERIKEFIQGRTKNHSFKQLLDRRVVWVTFQIVAGLILVYLAVVLSNISILRPGTFVGYTDQAPFKFGRYIASISRAASPAGGYCPEVYVTGDVGNATQDQWLAWYSNAPVRIASQNPSVSFNTTASFTGLSLGGGGHTNIEPGSSIAVTFVGHMDTAQCKDFKEADLQRLRHARMNASTEINVRDAKTNAETSQPISFRDLPIALGD